MWIYDAELDKLVNREIDFIPALFKIFDEIIVNAADNKVELKNLDSLRQNFKETTHPAILWKWHINLILNQLGGLPVQFSNFGFLHRDIAILRHFLNISC